VLQTLIILRGTVRQQSAAPAQPALSEVEGVEGFRSPQRLSWPGKESSE